MRFELNVFVWICSVGWDLATLVLGFPGDKCGAVRTNSVVWFWSSAFAVALWIMIMW